jgi:O-antigen ligase
MHSDPLQMLVELGVVGIIPWIAMVVVLAWATLSSIPYASMRQNIIVIGLSSGLLARLVGAFYEFPFRTSAVTLYTAVFLALLVAALELEPKRDPSNSSTLFW